MSLLYAVAYLGIAPAPQRGRDIDKIFRSYLAHPTGLRLAAVCLRLSGLVGGAAIVALIGRGARAPSPTRHPGRGGAVIAGINALVLLTGALASGYRGPRGGLP